MLLAYFGPETFLPLTSTIAAGVGLVLMFGRQILRVASGLARKAIRPIASTTTRSPASPLAARLIRADQPAGPRYRRPERQPTGGDS